MNLDTHDQALIAELYDKQADGRPPYNAVFAKLMKSDYSELELEALERTLNDKKTTEISTVGGHSINIDGVDRPIIFVAATEINDATPNHGEMASMLYLRDHVQTASAFMELSLSDPKTYPREGSEGRKLLMSALHLMSTPAQLQRFQSIIKQGGATQENWPHISLLFDDLEARLPNGWRNKQDTFQMLAYLACDAIERGFIAPEDLSESHKTFLGFVAPLLAAVGFPRYENSGSWEEIAANRTSVMAIETALLDKIGRLAGARPELAFLRGGLDASKILAMRRDGLAEIGRRLPFESPDYPESSIKFRGADAALAYALMYGIPQLLANEKVPVGAQGEVMTEQKIEELLIAALGSLTDPETGAMRRYDGDSYQRVNFHTNTVQKIIADIKRKVKEEAGDGEINLDKKQTLRGALTPQGREAAWTHPLGQLSAWAAKHSIQAVQGGDPANAARYRSLSTQFLNRALATITGDDQWHAVLDGNKQYVTRRVPAAKLPECYIAYQTASGGTFVVPSPHTPLNWSSAMLKEAVGLLRVVATMLQ